MNLDMLPVDPTKIIVAIIGGIVSLGLAWTRSSIRRENGSEGHRGSPIPVLALGLALTSLVTSVFVFSDARNPELQVAKIEIVAHTPGYQFGRETRPMSLPRLVAPRVNDSAADYVLSDYTRIQCDDGYVPIAAWHEIRGSHPALDVMYTVDANVVDEEATLSLRARASATGYAYVEVFLLCSRLAQAVQ